MHNKKSRFSSLKHDLPASIVVFLAALPLFRRQGWTGQTTKCENAIRLMWRANSIARAMCRFSIDVRCIFARTVFPSRRNIRCHVQGG